MCSLSSFLKGLKVHSEAPDTLSQSKTPKDSSSINSLIPTSQHLNRVARSEVIPTFKTAIEQDEFKSKPAPLPVLSRFAPLFSSSVTAKIWGVAARALDDDLPPTKYPEFTEIDGTDYTYTGSDFWTSGFFPGNMYLILERQRRWPHLCPASTRSSESILPHPLKLQFACQWWTNNLHVEANRTDTHDLGFMIQPWARKAWELNQDPQALSSLITAAHCLASRYSPKYEAIRSWDTCFTKRYTFDDPSKDFLVIIDNMMNLDLLFWVASQTQSKYLYDIAKTHAMTSAKHHIRADGSTTHVVNFSCRSGREETEYITNQGFSDTSCWSRGQAWAALSFAQTYLWTRDEYFLTISHKCTDYFLQNLPEDAVPYWDFAAPKPGPRDTSAAMVVVYALLHLYEIDFAAAYSQPELVARAEKWLQAAFRILDGVLAMSMSPAASFTEEGKVDMAGFDTILKNATINNYEFAPRRMADHGLVYADYYFLLVGNKLLELGLAW